MPSFVRKSGAPARTRNPASLEMLEQRKLFTAVAFTIDPSLSSLTLAGVIQTVSGSVSLTPQAAGSLTTQYAGTINTDVEPASIQFSNSSLVAAQNNGTWLPGPALGNYGAIAATALGTLPMAIRGLIAEGSSAVLPIASDGTFSSTAEALSINSGELDYSLEGDALINLIGLTANNSSATKSTYAVSNGQATLTVPVSVTYTTTVFTTNDTKLTLTGQIVSTAGAPVFAGSISGNVHAGSSLGNVTVYVDANNNGALDLGEPSTTTDGSGNYTLPGLIAGNYIVRQILPAGFKQASPANGFGNHITINGAQNVTNANFTDTMGPGAIAGSVRDGNSIGLGNVTVFADANNNGKIDAGEVKTVTSISGGYVLMGLAPGNYIIRQMLPAGYKQILPGNGFGIHTTLTSGRSVSNANFSDVLIGASSGSISGTVFDDANGNGKIDNGETGLLGWQLYIDVNSSHAFVAGDPTAMSDSNGNFTFSGLVPGDYLIRVVQPGAWLQTWPTMNFGWHIHLLTDQSLGAVLFGEISDG